VIDRDIPDFAIHLDLLIERRALAARDRDDALGVGHPVDGRDDLVLAVETHEHTHTHTHTHTQWMAEMMVLLL